jgi:hypothetical protein
VEKAVDGKAAAGFSPIFKGIEIPDKFARVATEMPNIMT